MPLVAIILQALPPRHRGLVPQSFVAAAPQEEQGTVQLGAEIPQALRFSTQHQSLAPANLQLLSPWPAVILLSAGATATGEAQSMPCQQEVAEEHRSSCPVPSLSTLPLLIGSTSAFGLN